MLKSKQAFASENLINFAYNRFLIIVSSSIFLDFVIGKQLHAMKDNALNDRRKA